MQEIGIQSRGIIRECVIEEGYKRIRNAGITCIDYDIGDNDEQPLQVPYFLRHRECAEQYGLRFSQVHAPVFRYEASNLREQLKYIIQETEKSIKICALLHSPYLVVHPYSISYELGDAEEKMLNLSFFQALINTAVENQVMICIENIPRKKNGRVWEGACSNIRDLKWYIETLNRKAGAECFGGCYDTGHANLFGSNMREDIRILGKYLKVLHIHDNDGVSDSHQIPYSFSNAQGGCATDWGGFLLGLRDIGFTGVLSFETYQSFVSIPGVLQDTLLKMLYEIGRNFSRVISYETVLYQERQQKRIIFGAGKMFNVYMQQFGKKYPPLFAVDNNEKLWGTVKSGVRICNPIDILKIPEEERLVIICNAYYEEICVQLSCMGVRNSLLSEEILRMNGKPI